MLYFVWIHRPTSRGALLIAFVLLACLAGGFFTAAGTAESYGGVLVDPLTAPQTPVNDMLFGIPLNLFAFSVAWIPGMLGRVLTRKASA